MTFGLNEAIEVASDLLGAVSGFALLVPTYRITKARALIHSRLKDLRSRAGAVPMDDLAKELLDADQATSQYEPLDGTLLRIGVWALTASFGLKLLFHCLTKSL